MWRIWAYALGRKEGRNKKDADKIAIIRTLIFLQLIVTNGFIIAGNIRHWNDGQCANTISGTKILTIDYK
jgi:hypothetical protein|tara:strand:- start:273 stop:482 length:210 start_codon:yes stop_codon:yes gene_type:complete